jgi:hypothetical protein
MCDVLVLCDSAAAAGTGGLGTPGLLLRLLVLLAGSSAGSTHEHGAAPAEHLPSSL